MKVSTLGSTAVFAACALFPATAQEPTLIPAARHSSSCSMVNVEHDATYCIAGSICSGSGPTPAGWNCPKIGDKAVADCQPHLASYRRTDNCIAHADAECRVIETGEWGCAWPTACVDDTPVAEANQPSSPVGGGLSTADSGSAGAESVSGEQDTTSALASNDTIQFPTTTGSLSLRASMRSGTSSTDDESGPADNTLILVVAAVVGVLCLVVGVILYRRRQEQLHQDLADLDAIRTPDYGYIFSEHIGPKTPTPISRNNSPVFYTTAAI